MKKLVHQHLLKFLSLVAMLLSAVHIQAQDSTAAGSMAAQTAWYGETWVWLAGGIISILFILALVRWSTKKKRKDNDVLIP